MTSENKDNHSSELKTNLDETKCPTILIQDEPTDIDAFGGHERVASAMHDLLIESTSGFSIGLEGNWGSGKSTIVNMLLAKLSHQSRFRHVLFDAWAHQGDPLRRSFLETLIQVLADRSHESEGWIDNEFASSQLDILQKRKKETIRRIFPNIKKKGAWLALGTLFIPIGITMLNSAFRDGISWPGSDALEPSWKAIFGIILSISPLIFIGIWALEWLLKRVRGKMEKPFLEFLNVGDFLNQKDSITERSEVIETPDPTSIEFEKMFNALLDRALLAHENRLLVIIDNIDRVDPEGALSILSTLQTFMDNTGRRSREWKKRLWILLPYSFMGIEKVISSETAAFIDKRFQIRFQVPPPVLTAYKQYLENQLCHAFPRHCEDQKAGTSSEFHNVYLVFDHFLAKGDIESTPRAIKLFVNQIGAIHRQWNDTIPLSHIAAYIILHSNKSSEKSDIVERIRQGSLVSEEGLTQFADAESITENLASLAFNVEAEQAMQLVLEPLIQSSLSSGRAEDTRDIRRNYPDAFWLIAEKIEFSGWLGSPDRLLNCVQALAELEIQSDELNPAQSRTIEKILITINEIENWGFLEDSQISKIVRVVDVVGPSQAFSILFSIMNRAAEDLTKGEEYHQNGTLISDLIEAVAQTLHTQSSNSEIENLELMIPGDIDFFLDVSSRIGSKTDTRWIARILRTEVNNNEAIDRLKGIINSGNFGGGTARSISTCRSAIAEFPQLEIGLLEEVSSRLHTGQPNDSREISALYFYLWDCVKKRINEERAKTVLKEASRSGLTFHFLKHAWGEANDTPAARLIFTQLYFYPNLQIEQAHENAPHAAEGQNLVTDTLFTSPAEHEDLIGKLITIMQRYGGFSRLHDLRKQVPTSEALVIHLFRNSLDRNLIRQVVPDDGVIEFLNFIKPGFGTDYINILSEFIGLEGVLQQVMDEPFDHELAEIYADIIKLDDFENEEYRLWIPAKLREQNRSTWANAFNTNAPLLGLQITRYETAGQFRLGVPISRWVS